MHALAGRPMTKMFDRLTRPFFFTGCIAAATAAFAVASFSATEAVATQTASTGVASEAPKELAWLALSETQAKRLGGDRVRLQAPDPTRRTFVIDKQGQAASFVALSFTSTKQHRVDCSLAEGTAALVEDRTLEGGTRTIGAAAAVQQCKSLAAGISALGSDGVTVQAA